MSDSPENQNKKISRTTEPDPDLQITKDKFPRFLLMSAQDPSIYLTKVSPWIIEGTIKIILGSKPKDIQKLRSGDILIEVDNHSHCQKLIRCTTLSDIPTNTNIPVRTRPHKILNFSKGVINSKDIGMCEEEEIMQRLRQQGVVGVKCLTRRTQEGVIRTGTYFLTFDTPDPPDHVIAGYLRIPVSPYIPNPLRCFNCQKLGHGQSKCRNQKVCWKCASPNHSSENCDADPFCVNCKEKHPSSDKKCKAWLKEKEIQKYKVLNKCSFPEARKAIDDQYLDPSVSYAAITKRKTIDSNTQTSIGTQVSGEEIEAEIREAPPSQNCIQCQHCHATIQTTAPPNKILFAKSASLAENTRTSVSQHKPISSSSATSSSHANQKKKNSTPPNDQTQVNKSSPHDENQAKTPNNNVPQPKPSTSNIKETTPLPTSNKYAALENEEMELSESQDPNYQKRPNDNDFELPKSQRRKLKKKQKAELAENKKDKRPPKGAYNPMKEAVMSGDEEEEMEFYQNSQPPSKAPISPILFQTF